MYNNKTSNKRRVVIAIAMIALMVLVVGCSTSSSNDNYDDPKYQRSYGGGCGVSGNEPQVIPEMTAPVAPEA